MPRGRKLTKEGAGAVKRLKQSSLVEKIKVCEKWIAVWFESGVFEKWSFDIPTTNSWHKIPKYRQLPENQKEWAKIEIPILDEDPIGFDAIFKNNDGSIADNFLVKPEDVAKGGIFDQRLLANKIVYKLLTDGWIKPDFKSDVLVKDWNNLKESYKPQKIPRSIIYARNVYPATKAIHGYAVWSHFFDLGSYKEKKPFTKCYDDPHVLISAVEKLLKSKTKITRTTVLNAVLKRSYPILSERNKTENRGYGPYEFRPNAYRDLFDRVLRSKNPIVLDYNPDLGSKAIATVLNNGIYIYKKTDVMKWANNFSSFSGGKLIEDDGTKTADISTIGSIGCLLDSELVLKLLPDALKRSACTLVFCKTGQEKEILKHAPTQNMVNIMIQIRTKLRFGIINKGKILIYQN